jgi:hypothetical protein
MSRIRLQTLLAAVAFALVPTSFTSGASTNAVLYWNEEVLNTTRLSRNPPPVASLHMATLHAAIFEAVNTITRTHTPWLNREPAPEGIDRDAAIAGAAHTVLVALWGQASNPRNFDVALDRALQGIPDGDARTAGLAWGKKIATAILAKRASAGLDKPLPGPFASNEPGKWRETPPGFRPAVLPHVSKVTPFVMKSPDQFRVPPPPPLDSKEFADDIALVARIGARDGAERTEYETLSAPFWADDLGSATPPGHWNVIAQDLARRRELSTEECARLFALLNFACADAGISCWDSKFHYNLWRPETAIREITKEVNPHAVAHPEFIPLMASPAFPGYTSGHSTFSSAASRLLERYFRTDDIEFTTTSDGLPGAVRSFKKLSDARREIGMSRVWGGIHFMCDNLAGQEAGIKIADWVYEQALQPTRDWTKP